MTSREMAGTFAEMRDILVAINGAMEGRTSEDLQDLVELAQQASTAYGTAPGEGFPEMDQFLNDVRFKIVNGQITPEEGAKELESAAEAVRNRSQHPDQIIIRHLWKPALLLGLLALAMGYWLYTTARQWRERRVGQAPQPTSTVRLKWAGVLFFVGLLHFQRLLFESDEFWTALSNNLFIMFVIPLCVLPLALFLAVCISREVVGAKLFRIVFFFPNILGGVAATLLWMHLYNPQGGPVNTVLVALGLEGFEGFAWLAQDNLYWALIPMSIWGAAGFNMVLFLAAMESIPQSMYEAADIDGASAWRQFWSITAPLIWEVLSIAIVFMIIGGMKAFEVIWLLTNQRPTTDNHVIGTRMVQAMFTEFKVGEATAIAVLLFLIVFFGTTATLRAMKREAVEF